MRLLFLVTALIEVATGLALILAPEEPVWLLLGSAIDAAGSVIARVAGAALFSLGVACWLARNDVQSPAAMGLLAAILFYNIAAVGLLAYAGLGLGLFGFGLWPAVLLHLAMAHWCITRGRIDSQQR